MTKSSFLFLTLIATSGLAVSQASAVPANYGRRITPDKSNAPLTHHQLKNLKPVKAENATFQLSVSNVENNKMIPAQYGYCRSSKRGTVKDGQNISPSITWTPPPKGTKSLAFIMVDKDVPISFENANRPDVTIDVNFKRQDFYHWVIVDIPPNVSGIMEGKDSSGITKGGKPVGRRTYGTVGQNDYVKITKGPHGGYEGPCPPWNDERMHHYHFTLYALDTPTLSLPTPVTGGQAIAAMQGHIIGKSEVVGTYTTYMPILKRMRKIKMLNAK